METKRKYMIFFIDTSRYYPDINQAITDIHNAGGLAFLAHPLIYPFQDIEYDLEYIVSSTNIDGLECEYPLFTYEQRNKLKKLCEKYSKYISGGSDYHANLKPNIKMGTGINNNLFIEKRLIDNWIKMSKV